MKEQNKLMDTTKNTSFISLTKWQQVALDILLFLVALSPRLIALQQFVTADEAKWIHRSAQFWLAVLHGNWAETVVKLKPAVTTMWSGGFGLWIYNKFHQNLPFADFLAAIPTWDVEPAMLHAARMPTILLACLSIVFIYRLLQPTLGFKTALLAGILLALDPLFLAHSRFLHHDALVTLFAVPAVLLAIKAAKGGGVVLISSAVLAGLAFLTKSPIFFLGPYVGVLFLGVAWKNTKYLKHSLENSKVTRWTNLIRVITISSPTMGQAMGRFMIFAGFSYLTFILVWPAAWIDPIGVPLAVILDAVKEAAPSGEEDLFINLGFFYYPVYFAFYITPVILIGLGAWWRQRKNLSAEARYLTDNLALFALTFIIFMTLSDKRSARYILPAFLPVTIIAASGWWAWLSTKKMQMKRIIVVILIGVQLLAVIPYAPYYITYTNPLLGGPLTAPHLIKIGWGEVMDQVGAWLNEQSEAAASVVGSYYASTLSPYFVGEVNSPTSSNLDYVVVYIKQRQGGNPLPQIQQYYQEKLTPLKTFKQAGIDYAAIYSGPAAQLADEAGPILAFRPHTSFIPIGQPLGIDLIWSNSPSNSTLIALELNSQTDDKFQLKESVTLSPNNEYTLSIPSDFPTGAYVLTVDGQKLGTLEARYAHPPAHFTALDVTFGDEIKLLGVDPNLSQTEDTLTVTLAWQATPKAWQDYTVYVHLITPEGERLTGHDAQPSPPSSQWLKKEVVLDSHLLSLPPDRSFDQPYQLRVGLYQANTGEALGEAYILPLTIGD